ncbi:MAG TPA: MauE/DoxX family redox-associated membrane protein [Gaiellaceae bacterium]
MRSHPGLPWIGLGIRLLAGGIFLFAGITKIVAGLSDFEDKVSKYQLLPHVLTAPFAYALPFIEVFVGLYLVLGLMTRFAAAVSCVLMVMFLVAIGQAWARGLAIDCGCFANAIPEKVGGVAFLRDLALGIPSLIMLIWPARMFSLDRLFFARPAAA